MLGLGVISLLLFVWLALLVKLGRTSGLDLAARAAVHRGSTPIVTQMMMHASNIGSPRNMAVFAAGLATALLLLRQRRAAVLTIIGAAGAVLLEITTKPLFRRGRPVPFFGYPPIHTYAFPSGHSLVGCTVLVMVAVVAGRKLTGGVARVVVAAAAVSATVLIGYSRIYLGVHYPTDVLGGFVLACAWLFILLGLDRWLDRARSVGVNRSPGW